MKNKKRSRNAAVYEKLKAVCQGIFGVLILLFAWYLACKFTKVGDLLADPITVFKLLISWFTVPLGRMTLPGHILVSMRRVFTAYVIFCAFGIVLGIVIGYSDWGHAILNPLYELIRPVPGVAWIPLTIMLLGVGENAKIFLICIGCFSGVTLQTSRGVRRVDRQLIGAAKVLGANEWQIFWRIILPSCVPNIFLGLNSALASAWSCVLAAEMICAFEGVGWIITAGSNRGNSAQILAGMIPIGVLGVLLTAFIMWLEKKLCKWAERSN